MTESHQIEQVMEHLRAALAATGLNSHPLGEPVLNVQRPPGHEPYIMLGLPLSAEQGQLLADRLLQAPR